MATINMDDYPSNAKYTQTSLNQEKTERKKLDPIIHGKATKTKQSFGKKLIHNFIAEDVGDIKDYIIWDCILPELKFGIVDVVSMMFTGEHIPRRGFGFGSGSSIRVGNNQGGNYYYNSLYGGSTKQKPSDRNRNIQDFTDVTFDTKADAQIVLEAMSFQVQEYETVTVGDFYRLCNIQEAPSDYNYGWKDLSRVRIERNREGYYLSLPRPSVV